MLTWPTARKTFDTRPRLSWSPHEPCSNTTIGSFERDWLGRYNINEVWAQPTHKGLTRLLTQNLKVMNLWVFILIWCSTFSFLLNVRFRLTLGFPTRTWMKKNRRKLWKKKKRRKYGWMCDWKWWVWMKEINMSKGD